MPTLYRIARWNEIYETHETRKLVRLNWVPVPNKHDGLGYRTVAAEKDGAALFGAWNLILQVASKSDRTHRGTLIRGDTPLTAASLAIITGFPERLFQRALSYFSQHSIGWLLAEQWQTDLPFSPDAPGDAPENLPDEGKGREGKEGKEKRQAASPMPLPFSSDSFAQAWAMFGQHRRELRKPLTPTASKMALEQLERMGEDRAIAAIKHTIAKGWQGIREPDGPPVARYSPPKPAAKECPGWKAIINHEFPESIYADGQSSEAHRWEELSPDAQRLCWQHYRAKSA